MPLVQYNELNETDERNKQLVWSSVHLPRREGQKLVWSGPLCPASKVPTLTDPASRTRPDCFDAFTAIFQVKEALFSTLTGFGVFETDSARVSTFTLIATSQTSSMLCTGGVVFPRRVL